MPPKQTRLDDGAAIYQHRDRQTEKEKLSEMTKQEKWSYFKQYYLLKLVILIFAIILTGYFLYTVLSPKPDVYLNVTMLNYYLTPEQQDAYAEELEDYFKIDKENQEITVDASYNLNGTDSYTYYQKLMVMLAAGEIDVIIAPESVFASYAASGSMMCITDYTTDVLSKILDKNSSGELNLFKCKQKETDADGKEVEIGQEEPYGIYVTDFELLKNYSSEQDPMLIGIVVNTKNKDNAAEYIRYALNLK